MKVLLVVPPRPRNQALQIMPPLGLWYLATSLMRHNYSVDILDCTKDKINDKKFALFIIQTKPDIIGFSMFSADFLTVREYSRVAKSIKPSIKVVAGGIHPSSVPQETLLALESVDYCFKGEAEVGLVNLVSHISESSLSEEELEKIPGLIWRDNNTIKVNSPLFVDNLDSLGFPSWDLINPLDYQAYPPTLFVRKRPFAPIIITRGCPYQCTFCAGSNVTGNKMRSRSLEDVMAEIDILYNGYGIREIHIEDDNFTYDCDFVKRFCESLLHKKLNLTWTMPNGVRLNTLDRQTLSLMKRAGCYLIIVGIESGSPQILRHMKKGLTVELIEEKVRLIKEEGIYVHGFFMLGYPKETMDDIKMTLGLALRLDLMGAHFSNFHPLPGTEITQTLIQEGELKDINLDTNKLSFATVVYTPKGINFRELKRMQRKMLRRFYLRPKILIAYLKEMRYLQILLSFLKKATTYMFSK